MAKQAIALVAVKALVLA